MKSELQVRWVEETQRICFLCRSKVSGLRPLCRPSSTLPNCTPGTRHTLSASCLLHRRRDSHIRQLGIGAVLFSIVIGLAMSFIFRKEEKAKKE